MRLLTFIGSQVKQRRAERDYVSLDRVAGHLINDYRRAVQEGAPCQVIAEILTGLAGCEFAMSRTNPAMGWGTESDADGCTVGESCRRSGLLLLELAYVVGDDEDPVEFQQGVIAEALQKAAVAYRDDPVMVGQRLDELWHAVVDVIGGQAAEVLLPLMLAHEYWLYQCTCGKHHAYVVEASCD